MADEGSWQKEGKMKRLILGIVMGVVLSTGWSQAMDSVERQQQKEDFARMQERTNQFMLEQQMNRIEKNTARQPC